MLYAFIFRQIISELMRRHKNVAVTASTGIARLHFHNGQTLHHWSAYGDGHLHVDQLIQDITLSNIYEKQRECIKKCDCLIIDEIGMISGKMFSEVELICRTVRGVNTIFGGIQIIGCGSFYQLPPVPSATDNGSFAFQSKCFLKVFPHIFQLKSVHRQKELDLVRAVNDLCEGNICPRTHQLLLSLQRPLNPQLRPLYIFGTNYDVDFFNYMTLEKLDGEEHLFTAEDNGMKITYRKCGAHKYLVLKKLSKVIVTRNLYNGLVNGISGIITAINSDSVTIKVDTDQHLNHSMEGKEFSICRYTFIKRDHLNQVTAVRKQLPLKLGYAVTVDKSQGRTLDAVVVDSTNFWRPGQMGVAVGRATSKEAIEISHYNREAAAIPHPKAVTDFYCQRSLLMKENLSCCCLADIDTDNFLTKSTEIKVSTFPDSQLDSNAGDYLDTMETVQFPFDVNQYIDQLIKDLPKVTQIQLEQVQILQEAKNSDEFGLFLSKAFTVTSNLFNMYKVAAKKNKCNWCRLCSHLHTILTSSTYKLQVMKAFKQRTLHWNENAICTRIYFNLLQLISEREASDKRKKALDEYLSQESNELELDALDKSSLRYIAGATIHSLRDKLENLSLKQVMNDAYRSKLNYRKHQLTSKLIGPPQKIAEKSVEPESLYKILEKDYGGLLYVTDETFQFFKLLLLRTRSLQNLKSLQIDPQSVFIHTVSTLNQDADLISAWFDLFSPPQNLKENCECDEFSDASEISTKELIELELDETLIMDLYEGVVHYFSKVHCAEKVNQLKDFVLQKPKTFQLRHTLDENPNKDKQHIIQYPCGICAKECIGIINKRKAAFEDFSVQCNKCDKWYHYICVNLTGDEPELKENSIYLTIVQTV